MYDMAVKISSTSDGEGGGGRVSLVSVAIGSPNIFHLVADSGNTTHDPRIQDGVPGRSGSYISSLPTEKFQKMKNVSSREHNSVCKSLNTGNFAKKKQYSSSSR